MGKAAMASVAAAILESKSLRTTDLSGTAALGFRLPTVAECLANSLRFVSGELQDPEHRALELVGVPDAAHDSGGGVCGIERQQQVTDLVRHDGAENLAGVEETVASRRLRTHQRPHAIVKDIRDPAAVPGI